MPVTRDRSSSVRSRRSSSAWVSRSSSAPIRRRGLSSCPSDGSWSARLRGSADAAGSPRTGRTSTARRSPSSASLPSVSCYEGFATLHDVLGQTLRRADWAELLDDEEHSGALVPIFALAHEHDPDPTMRPYQEPMSPARREQLIAGMAAGITAIYRYFEPRRRAAARLNPELSTSRR